MCISVEFRKCELLAFTSATPKFILQPVKSTESHPSQPLADLRRGDVAVVTGLADASVSSQDGADVALITRLRDLGFTAGARCEVMARMWLGGDPLVVRVGGSTFALRRAEASAVRVQRLHEQVRPSAALEPKDARAATA